ncbi:MAG: hypothetical protein L0Z62_07255, partial [Gemmataceae bacterium]|nr:hypothetical protein [Gemmataceae bacterium]
MSTTSRTRRFLGWICGVRFGFRALFERVFRIGRRRRSARAHGRRPEVTALESREAAGNLLTVGP